MACSVVLSRGGVKAGTLDSCADSASYSPALKGHEQIDKAIRVHEKVLLILPAESIGEERPTLCRKQNRKGKATRPGICGAAAWDLQNGEKRDFSLRRPTRLREQTWKEKASACSVRNDRGDGDGGAEGQ